MLITNLSYVLASVLFIFGIKKLSHPKTARKGNFISAMGMLIAIVATLVSNGQIDLKLILIGMIIGSIIKNAIKILATNPTARKKAGEVAFKAYNKAKPIIKKTSKSLKETLDKNLTK